MASENTAHATLIGPMRFDVLTGSQGRVTVDVGAGDGGTSAGPSPMELLLVALAGCTGMDTISILRKKRQQVTGYVIDVRGVRADDHPRVYTAITVEHLVTGHAVDPQAVRRAIELTETKYCPVGAMLGKATTITHSFRIEEASAHEETPG